MSKASEDRSTEVGSVHISVLLDEDGTAPAFELTDLSTAEAIGYVTVVLDRLRREAMSSWSDITDDLECPHCGEPYIEKDSEDDDE